MSQRTVCTNGHILENREPGEACGKQGRNSGMSFYACTAILIAYERQSGAGTASSTVPTSDAVARTAAPDPDPPLPPGPGDFGGSIEHLLETFIPRSDADPLFQRIRTLIGTLVASGVLGEEEGKEANEIIEAIDRIVPRDAGGGD